MDRITMMETEDEALNVMDWSGYTTKHKTIVVPWEVWERAVRMDPTNELLSYDL